jgi:NAD(P)-dependent dehydrogenase (short-subunit alcohol dehydrogenase family)
VVARELSGTIAVVTGASRGAGKGIALELGAAGATVYVTGRSVVEGTGPRIRGEALPGTVGATADEVTAMGGTGIAVRCDHAKDDEVEALFRRVEQEQGRLDILVNNAYAVPDTLLVDKPFWDQPLSLWDEMTDVGLRSSYVASVFGARIMVPRRSGLIVFTSSYGGGHYSHSVSYGVGKAAIDRMAADVAHELRPYDIASVSLWLGLISTERTIRVAAADTRFDVSQSETPRFVGRCVVALATDPDVMRRSGKVLLTAELGEEYAFTDVDGTRPKSLRDRFGGPPAYLTS